MWCVYKTGPLITIDKDAKDGKTVEEVATNKLAWQISALINSRVPGVEVVLSRGNFTKYMFQVAQQAI